MGMISIFLIKFFLKTVFVSYTDVGTIKGGVDYPKQQKKSRQSPIPGIIRDITVF